MLNHYDSIILNHIYNYRITTLSVLHKALFPNKTLEEIRELCKLLRNKGFIGDAPLHPYENYYHLTKKAAKELYNDESKNVSEYLEIHQLVEAYAMLAFCCLQKIKRGKITEHKLLNEDKDLTINKIISVNDNKEKEVKIPSNNYYKDTVNGKKVIGWLKVDFGFHHERAAQRIYPIIKKRFKNEKWKRLIINGSFIITVATAWETKAQRLRECIRDDQKFKNKIYKCIKRDFPFEKDISFPLKVYVCEVPELKFFSTKY